MCGIELEWARPLPGYQALYLVGCLSSGTPSSTGSMGGGEEKGRGGMFVSEVYAARLFTTPRSAGRVEIEMVFLLRNVYRVNSTPPSLTHFHSLRSTHSIFIVAVLFHSSTTTRSQTLLL